MQEKKVAIASDHGGFLLKEKLVAELARLGYDVLDKGTDSADCSVNYPDYAAKVAKSIQQGEADRGVLICTSGVGMSIAANRYSFIRGALVFNREMAYLCRAHNNANVLIFGAKFISEKEAKACLKEFLNTDFEGGRHVCRVDQLERMGK
ncbi:MAG: ribose 5-phosphate isomerase B [Alphaproteobacteria bacterium]|nr:ribose 5-phosphate isomerase B [Alphaproteobacteria bacterium]